MAQIPSLERNVSQRPLPGNDFRASDQTAGLRMIGAGLEHVGDQGADFVEQQQRTQALHDEAAAKQATNAVNQHWSEAAFTGDNPYFNTQGRTALDQRPALIKDLDTHIADVRKGLKTERQRKMFDDAVVPQRQTWAVQVAQHAQKETETWAAGESEGRAATSAESAKLNYVRDPNLGESYIVTGLHEIAAKGKLLGWGDEQTKAEQLKYESGVRHDVAMNLAAAGPQGRELAAAFVEKHADTMTADARLEVANRIETEQRQAEAEQRRIEAEARREAREARSDARDRASSVYRNIQDGVVVDPKTLAGAMSDARAADDPALVEGLRQGGLKNSLTQQWASATPADLQERINTLSAEITSKGGKVAPDKIVERDHLQTLVGKSRSALGNDPYAWASEHLGLTVPKLVLSNPDSVNARINIATQIANRTGTLPRPFQQDEAAAFQQVLTHGDVKAKVDLALKVARLGPLALAGAEQLTNNTGFHNLIGLATIANRGVAASRVNQVVTGYEVLKTKPNLFGEVGKKEARREFDEAVGSALQFLPQVSQGAFSNAQALLATQANEHGWNEWGDAKSGWYRAVNSALGAYPRDGKEVGGLWKLNGGITILPEGMTGTEFEDRISKSHGAEFRKAQNEEPAPMSNGQVPTATELKRMQWVPSGDGVYRLSDGNGFVHTKSGGFYEVDAAKLSPSSISAENLARYGYVRR